jgi:triosephosphate isomerase (TIM)
MGGAVKSRGSGGIQEPLKPIKPVDKRLEMRRNSMLSTKLVVGNWKMHGRLSDNAALLAAIAAGLPPGDAVRVGVCVPFPYLAQAQAVLAATPIQWGAQDVSAHLQGAYTGEVSASMAAEFGATFALIGHSERRTCHAECDDAVAAKTLRALDAGLTPVVCVGETDAQREAGLTEAVVGAQLRAVLAALSAEQVARIVVAYEPVWAIGSGKSASVAQAQQVHAFLRSVLAETSAAAAGVALLYGGSVNPDNAAELFGAADIDGGLIGGASLKAADFLAVCAAACA